MKSNRRCAKKRTETNIRTLSINNLPILGLFASHWRNFYKHLIINALFLRVFVIRLVSSGNKIYQEIRCANGKKMSITFFFLILLLLLLLLLLLILQGIEYLKQKKQTNKEKSDHFNSQRRVHFVNLFYGRVSPNRFNSYWQ